MIEERSIHGNPSHKVTRRGHVYIQDRYAGVIEQSEDGYVFAYSVGYLAEKDPLPVSLTLSLRAEPYFSKTLFPFFDGLIPEGWLLDIAVKTWKVNPRDRMGLLLSVCKDCVGAVSVMEDLLAEGEVNE
jgi:serine/threonine-protein kinase HipA